MKRAHYFLFSLMAFALLGCTKGTIEGKVVNPFTGEPVAGAIVQLTGTTVQPVTTLEDGTFSFPKLKIQEYKIVAGMNNFSKSETAVALTEESTEAKQEIYIFNRKEEVGLYASSDSGMVKVPNFWVSYEVDCGEGLIAYQPTMSVVVNKKKSKSDLPTSLERPLTGNYLLYEKSSATALPELKVAPIKRVKASEVPSCAEKAKESKTFLVADMKNAETVPMNYKSNSLYEVSPTLNSGEQLLYFYQAGKPLKGYLVNAK